MLRAPRRLAVALTAVGLAACGDASPPTQPDPERAALCRPPRSQWPRTAGPPRPRSTPPRAASMPRKSRSHPDTRSSTRSVATMRSSPAMQFRRMTSPPTPGPRSSRGSSRFNTNGTGKIGTIVYVSGGYARRGPQRPRPPDGGASTRTDRPAQRSGRRRCGYGCRPGVACPASQSPYSSPNTGARSWPPLVRSMQRIVQYNPGSTHRAFSRLGTTGCSRKWDHK